MHSNSFPAPPLKFRTSGFPQYGFKLEFNHNLRRSGPGLSSEPAYARNAPTCMRSEPIRWIPVALSGMSGGTRCMGDPVQRSFAPQRVLLSRRIDATMTSSETLWAFRRLIYFVLADLCPTALSGLARRGSPICSACLFFRAAVRTPVGMVTAYDRSFVTITGLRRSASGSAPTEPHRRFSGVA